MTIGNRGISVCLAGLACTLLATEASAIPAFARKYGVTCALCHAPPPRLNTFGEQFAANGFQFAPGEEPRDTIATGDALLRLQRSLPLAIRYDAYLRALTRTRSDQSAADFQTPWVVKLLSGGQVAEGISYYAYFLLGERGEVAGLEDAYLQFNDVAGTGVSLILGQFQVSDPLFKRELRLEYEDYHPYRVRVGQASADLTYDRGLMALYSPREGTDVAFQVVSGQGLNAASANRQFDGDDAKSTALRLSQDIGSLRLGAFGYRGYERRGGYTNSISVWGPDVTLGIGTVAEVNGQFLRRVDRDPFFSTCSIATPCPGGTIVPFGTTVDALLAELVVSPGGPAGRVFLTGLYNWIDSDRPVVSLRLGEQASDPGYLSRYRMASGGVHYLYRRNVRMMTELGWDLDRKQARVVAGTVVAF